MLKEHNRRKLYLIVHEYSNGDIYQGYYVENSALKGHRAQAYRHKTITNGTEHIEDAKAYDKACNCLVEGFNF